MPVTGQHALTIETAFLKRVTFMRTAVVASEHTLVGEENDDLPAILAKQLPARGFEIL